MDVVGSEELVLFALEELVEDVVVCCESEEVLVVVEEVVFTMLISVELVLPA